MPLTQKEEAQLVAYVGTKAMLAEVRGELTVGRQAKPEQRKANYEAIVWLLKSALLIVTDVDGVYATAEIIASAQHGGPAVQINLKSPPLFDAEAEKARVKTECGHSSEIEGVYVQLDIDQNKHQPSSVPIGTRQVNGEKFGDYATKKWHEGTTMAHMADWAKDLPGLVEGKKKYHGQGIRVYIKGVDSKVCFEGFCVLLGGVRHVSFHCYPNSR